nr:alpha/beta hydrolase [Streptomyces sp. So13.3]
MPPREWHQRDRSSSRYAGTAGVRRQHPPGGTLFRFGMSRWRISAESGAVVAAMVAAALPAAAVTVTGGGDHGQYLNGNACVDGIVTGYLLTGAAPAHDTSCAANPLPVPDPARTGPYALS